jgi:hypothetical protein
MAHTVAQQKKPARRGIPIIPPLEAYVNSFFELFNKNSIIFITNRTKII